MIDNKRGNKALTTDIEINFEAALNELWNMEPIQKAKKITATSLIIKHRVKIQELLAKGFDIEQVVNQLAKIGLVLTKNTILGTLRNIDKDGNRIVKKVKHRKSTVKTTTDPEILTVE